MEEIDIEYESFNCNKMGTKISITREILIHRSSATGEIDKKFARRIECDARNECGIAKSTGSSITYDWTECVHPDLKQ
jgi:hypothetical protein